IIGWSLIGTSVVLGSYPAYESVFLKKKYNKRKMKENLQQAFMNAELYKKHGDKKEYPNIIRFDNKNNRLTFVFNLPKGLHPEKVENALFVFKQHFSEHVSLDV